LRILVALKAIRYSAIDFTTKPKPDLYDVYHDTIECLKAHVSPVVPRTG